MTKAIKEVSFDFKEEIGGTVYVKNKNGVAEESNISILDGKYVGEKRVVA